MPRKFDPILDPEDEIIYEAEDEVAEMYFFIGGKVGVGYRPPAF
jgi:hypothetical protein